MSSTCGTGHRTKSSREGYPDPDRRMSDVRRLAERGEAKVFTPSLPTPPDEGKTVRISYVKPRKDVVSRDPQIA
jgi:hypothetical protein